MEQPSESLRQTRTCWYIDAPGVSSLKRRYREANSGQHIAKVLLLVVYMTRSKHRLALFVNGKGARSRCQDEPQGQPLLLTSRLLTARRLYLEFHQDLSVPL